MARAPTTRVPITKKDGTPTAYFWLSGGNSDVRKQTIYKRTKDGIKRITGAHFDAIARKVVKHA